MEAGGRTTDATLFAVRTVNSSPVARETVPATRASADGGAHLVNRSGGHRRILNTRSANNKGPSKAPVGAAGIKAPAGVRLA